MTRVHARKDKIVTGLTKGIEFLFKKNKIEWIKGSARLLGKGKIEVTDADKKVLQTLTAKKEIIVATGSSPRSVPGIAIDKTHIITSDQAIHLPAVPKRMAIMGSGAVGVEFAVMAFANDVAIIEARRHRIGQRIAEAVVHGRNLGWTDAFPVRKLVLAHVAHEEQGVQIGVQLRDHGRRRPKHARGLVGQRAHAR